MHLGAARQRQGERAAAGKEIGDMAGPTHRFDHRRRQHRLAMGGGLKKGAGRRDDTDAVKALARRGAHGDRLVLPDQPGDPLLAGQLRQRHPERAIQRFAAPGQHVQPVL